MSNSANNNGTESSEQPKAENAAPRQSLLDYNRSLASHHNAATSRQTAAVSTRKMAQSEPPQVASKDKSLPKDDATSQAVSITPSYGLPRPPPRAAFLLDIPDFAYIMPYGPILNFTMVEIVAILPNWFKHQQIATRFQNNGINTAVQVMMLQRFRGLNQSDHELARTKDGISEFYRKMMRLVYENWTKAEHKAPKGWNANSLAVNNFRPDKGVTREPCCFKDLAEGVTHLPQGADAADLTRALQFALENNKLGPDGRASDYMFPDDIHNILDRIQYTKITSDHTDGAIVKRYNRSVKETIFAKQKRHRDLGETGPSVSSKHRSVPIMQMPPPMASQPDTLDTVDSGKQSFPQPPVEYDLLMGNGLPSLTSLQTNEIKEKPYANQPYNHEFGHNLSGAPDSGVQLGMLFASLPTQQQGSVSALAQPKRNQTTESSAEDLQVLRNAPQSLTSMVRTSSDFETAVDVFATSWEFQSVENTISAEDEIDDLIARHQQYDFTSVLNSPEHHPPIELPLLRNCAEADDPDDHSKIARAARWCRNPKNNATEYTIWDVEFIISLEEMSIDTD